jgi:Na+-translocating ferredoxin:NAD+ oxidoreductase RnfG subunit
MFDIILSLVTFICTCVSVVCIYQATTGIIQLKKEEKKQKKLISKGVIK